MPISMSQYVDITSVVGAQASVPQRNLGALIVTNNNLVPTNKFIAFTSANDVGNYFGTASEEYLRAVFYFGWINKQGGTPNQLAFWFWNNDAATADLIFGAPPISSLSTLNAITSGELTLTMGGFTHTLTGINLSAAGSLAAVATDLTTAINGFSGGGAAWTGATVTYNSTSGAFNLVGGTTGLDTIAVTAAVSNDLAGPIGWLNAGTIVSNGTAAQTVTANLIALNTLDNNFGSFLFTSGLALSLTNIEAVAAWNNALTPNNQFLYTIPVTTANASAWSAALLTTGGCTMTLAPLSNEYPEMVPSMIAASTDYTKPNSVQDYEFNVFNLTPSVTNDADYATYNALKINFYGQTQTAGQLINFYQTGVMFGTTSQPQFQNIYINELWLKDALTASIMNLLLALNQLPANNQGISQLYATLQPIINQALINGTISAGKTLDSTQQLYITNFTDNNQAWIQVQNIGYWLGVEIESFVQNAVTKFKAVFSLVYSKDDTINFVSGIDVLI